MAVRSVGVTLGVDLPTGRRARAPLLAAGIQHGLRRRTAYCRRSDRCSSEAGCFFFVRLRVAWGRGSPCDRGQNCRYCWQFWRGLGPTSISLNVQNQLRVMLGSPVLAWKLRLPVSCEVVGKRGRERWVLSASRVNSASSIGRIDHAARKIPSAPALQSLLLHDLDDNCNLTLVMQAGGTGQFPIRDA